MPATPFRFKQFKIEQAGVAHPVGTDSVLLGAWSDVTNCNRILDIGTGTGIVALMMAQRNQTAEITAVDIHPGSAQRARANFDAAPWARRMTVYESSIQDFAATSPGQYDLIASNPPFFSEITVSPHPERRLGRYAGALPPGALIDVVNQLLAPNGHCCLILPVTEGKRFCELAALKGLYYTRITEVQTIVGKPVERLLIQLEKSPYDFKRESLTIYQEREVYTEGFRRLTKDFYLGITNIE